MCILQCGSYNNLLVGRDASIQLTSKRQESESAKAGAEWRVDGIPGLRISTGDVFVSRLFDDYRLNGAWHAPREYPSGHANRIRRRSSTTPCWDSYCTTFTTPCADLGGIGPSLWSRCSRSAWELERTRPSFRSSTRLWFGGSP